MITKEQFESGYTYTGYRKMVDELVAAGKTSGSEQEEGKIAITALNADRMARIDKSVQLNENLVMSLKEMPCPVKWLIIVEAWCKDAAQNVPILNKMAESAPNIQLRLVLRDENPEIMDQYLTNGTRSVPKLIIMDDQMEEITTWGPRPKEVQDMVMENKRTGAMPMPEYLKVVQKWYAKNKGAALQKEMVEVLSSVGCF